MACLLTSFGFLMKKLKTCQSWSKNIFDLAKSRKFTKDLSAEFDNHGTVFHQFTQLPLGMLKRSHDFPRLVFNKAQAYTTDTTYRVRCKRFNKSTLVASFINSLTALVRKLKAGITAGAFWNLCLLKYENCLFPSIDLMKMQLTN